MSYDLLIKNGTVVDGTGAARYRADIAIADGKIAQIEANGKVTEGAKKVVDASDLIVAPGFVDPHTHYDAQICWDPLVTCSSSANSSTPFPKARSSGIRCPKESVASSRCVNLLRSGNLTFPET